MINPSNQPERAILSKSGFTLLELLISMTITAVIITIVFGGLRISVRAWEKGAADTEYQDRYRNVLMLLRKQIISVYTPTERENSKVEDPFSFFEGEENSMRFFSHRSLFSRSLDTDSTEVVFVTYRIIEDSSSDRCKLGIIEENTALLQENHPLKSAAPEDALYELVAGAGEIMFEYLKIETVDAETGVPEWFWQPSWNSDEEEALPRAVRITFRPAPSVPPLHVVIPVEKNPLS